MSNSHLFLSHGFPRAPLVNGVGRYMCQLKRVVIKYCKSDGASRGMRDFLEQDLVDFAIRYPSVVVYVKPRRHRSAVIKGEYCSGDDAWMSMKNLPREEIRKWLELFVTQKDGKELRLRKKLHTDNPSIQGPWTPYIHKDPRLNIATFPNEELSKPIYIPKSATDQLFEVFQEQQRQERLQLEEKQGE